MKTLIAALAVLTFSSFAEARELAGVKLDETINVQGKDLKLNGAGIRKKAIFKVYVGALYVENISKDGAALLASDQTMRVKEVFVRNVDKGKITDAFSEELKKAAGGAYDKFKDRIDKLMAAIPDLKDGDDMVFTYVPGKGTTFGIKDVDQVTIEGKDFQQLLFGLWLGPNPGDRGLADAMLSK